MSVEPSLPLTPTDEDAKIYKQTLEDKLQKHHPEEVPDTPPEWHKVVLDSDDPIERVLIEIVQLNRKKRHDYADDNDIFSNFREAGEQTNTDALTVCEMHIATKQARLKNLTKKSVTPKNESIRDTRLDRAVYSVIAVALNDSSI